MCNPSPPRNYLRDQGLHVVRRPREGIAPLDLFEEHERTLHPLGRLSDLLLDDARVRLPEAEGPHVVAGLSQTTASGVDLSVGLDLIGSAFSPYRAQLETTYRNAKSVDFTFGDVVRHSVPVTSVEIALSDFRDRDLGTANRERARNGRLFFASVVLEAASIKISAISQLDKAIQLGAEVVAAAGGGLSSKIEGSRNEVLALERSTRIAFAIEARQIVFEDGVFRTTRPGDPHLVTYSVEEALTRLCVNEGRLAEDSLLVQMAHSGI